MIPRMDDKEYHRKRLDISYADRTPAEKFDIFYPEEGDGPFPVFVEVHGGAWYFGQKRSVEFEPFLYGLNRGYACVSLGYTLSPEGHYPLPVLEIKSAIRFCGCMQKNISWTRVALYCGEARQVHTWLHWPLRVVIPAIWKRICLEILRYRQNRMRLYYGMDVLITLNKEGIWKTGFMRTFLERKI